MNYMESYPWFTGSQFLPGLDIEDVQLPGSELLLPIADGNFVEPTTTSIQKTKHDAEGDLDVEDNWINLSFDGDCFHNDSSFEPDELLPSSPEVTSCDLNTADFIHVIDDVTFDKKADVLTSILDVTPDVCPSVAVLGVDPAACNTAGNIFDEDGRLHDFDLNWLLPPEPILPSVSPEEVESVLSAPPPLDRICSEERWGRSGTEFEAHVTKSRVSLSEPSFDCSHLASLQVSQEQFILFATSEQSSSGLVTTCPPHSHQNGLNWVGSEPFGRSLLDGFMTDSTLLMTTTAATVPDLGISSAGSPGTTSESESSVGPITNKSNHSLVRAAPYSTCGAKPERQEKKKEQNKTAALKYRQKKREEQGVFVSECEQLEKRNMELKSRAEELTREINYLKGLISEIYSSECE